MIYEYSHTKHFLQHPAVSECVILGLPDKDYGEIVGALIVPHADVKAKRDQESKPVLTLEELSTWAKEKIAPYKVSQHDHFCFLSVYKIYNVKERSEEKILNYVSMIQLNRDVKLHNNV